MEWDLGFVLVTPLLWPVIYFLVRRSPTGRIAFWPGLIVYVVAAVAIGLKLTVFHEGMGDLAYLIFGSYGLSLYTLACLCVAWWLKPSAATGNVIVKMPSRPRPSRPVK